MKTLELTDDICSIMDAVVKAQFTTLEDNPIFASMTHPAFKTLQEVYDLLERSITELNKTKIEEVPHSDVFDLKRE